MSNIFELGEPAYRSCQLDQQDLDEEILFDNPKNEQNCIHGNLHCGPAIQDEPPQKTETTSSYIQSDRNNQRRTHKESQKWLPQVKLKIKKTKAITKSRPQPMLQKKQNRENQGNNMDRDTLRAFRKSISEYFQQNTHLKILWAPIKKLLVCKNINKSQIAALICIFEFLGARLQIWSMFNQILFLNKFQENTPARKEAEKTLASWNRGFFCDKLREITLELHGSRKFDMEEALKQSENIVDKFKNDYYRLRRN